VDVEVVMKSLQVLCTRYGKPMISTRDLVKTMNMKQIYMKALDQFQLYHGSIL